MVMKNKKHVVALFFAGLILFSLAVGEVLAGELSLALSKKTDFARIDFGPLSSPAYNLVWAGDVLNGGSKIGEFTATLTKINYGTNGTVLNYDLTIPFGDIIPEFLSIKTNRVVAGTGSVEKGIVYAGTPVLKGFIGSAAYLEGDNLRIVY
jgi:hypothetical protein